MKSQVEKSEMMFLFQVMPQSFPTLCAESGEFDRLLEVVWLHTHPLTDDEFVLTQSPVGDGGVHTNPDSPICLATFC